MNEVNQSERSEAKEIGFTLGKPSERMRTYSHATERS